MTSAAARAASAAASWRLWSYMNSVGASEVKVLPSYDANAAESSFLQPFMYAHPSPRLSEVCTVVSHAPMDDSASACMMLCNEAGDELIKFFKVCMLPAQVTVEVEVRRMTGS